MSSSRTSLHDCILSLSLPVPHSSTSDRTECYIGETLYLHLSISPSTSPPSSTFHSALQSFSNLQVTLGTDFSTSRQCPLPVLNDSPWTSTTRPDSDVPVFCKGIWALVRTPPGIARTEFDVEGRQRLFVVLRESHVSQGLRNSPVWATIDKASRLFGKAAALVTSRQIMVNMPVQISCYHAKVADCAERSFVCVSLRNVTSDAVLSVVPPYINLNFTRIVVNSERGGDRGEKVEEEITSLDERYEFVPMFTGAELGDDEESAGELELDNTVRALGRQNSGAGSTEDYGLFIPSFSYWLKRAVSLGPREVFNFVYKIAQKGSSQHDVVEDEAENGRSNGVRTRSNLTRDDMLKIERTTRRLKPGTCLETSVAVAWKCVPNVSHDPSLSVSQEQELQREMSAGGVLATGKRGNVAVCLTSVHWQPPLLLNAVVVTFSGPPMTTLGANISVSISILNQTDFDLAAATVLVQQGESSTFDLLALRTVVGVGRIASGGEATLQLPCVALRAGTVSLGPVQVVDWAAAPDSQNIWTSQATFQVFVVDPAAKVPGDPSIPTSVGGMTKLENENKVAVT